MGFHREDLTFGSGGERCAVWLYLPGDTKPLSAPAPLPCVVLAHGFGGTRAGRLWAFAERFADAGFAALVFDYRHFGESGGTPRQLLDIGRQLDDWREAISFARSLPEVDPEQVVAWGTSFSGGHVAVIAAEDRRLAGAISQHPFVDGPSALKAIGLMGNLRLTRAALRDEWARLRDADPHTIPIVGEPGTTAAMTNAGDAAGYSAMYEPGEPWVNEVAARVALRVALYRPGATAASIACPWLVQVSEDDAVTPPRAACAAAAQAPWSQLLRYGGGHFDVYVGEGFERAVDDQIAFLRRILAPLPLQAALAR